MFYVTSDIHSNYVAFKKILDKLDAKKDQLFINGDVIDRGNDGFKILDEIMKTNNVHLIMGNHEAALLNVFIAKDLNNPKQEQMWKDYWFEGGGEKSYHYFFEKLSKEKQEEYIKFLLSCSYEELLKIGGKYFYIVHACPSNDKLEKIADRKIIYAIIREQLDIIIENTINGYDITCTHLSEVDKSIMLNDEEKDYIINPTVIVGHNSTKYWQDGEIGKICKYGNIINIDCGSNGYYNREYDRDGFKGRLALLCLNNMQVEYY